MKFWKNKNNTQSMPTSPYVVKLKQDRYKEWIVSEVRVEAQDDIELKKLLDNACKVADDKCYLLNLKDSDK